MSHHPSTMPIGLSAFSFFAHEIPSAFSWCYSRYTLSVLKTPSSGEVDWHQSTEEGKHHGSHSKCYPSASNPDKELEDNLLCFLKSTSLSIDLHSFNCLPCQMHSMHSPMLPSHMSLNVTSSPQEWCLCNFDFVSCTSILIVVLCDAKKAPSIRVLICGVCASLSLCAVNVRLVCTSLT